MLEMILLDQVVVIVIFILFINVRRHILNNKQNKMDDSGVGLCQSWVRQVAGPRVLVILGGGYKLLLGPFLCDSYSR